jgi:hypothetical protein
VTSDPAGTKIVAFPPLNVTGVDIYVVPIVSTTDPVGVALPLVAATVTPTESSCPFVIVAAPGVTVTVGATAAGVEYFAVIVTFPETVTLHDAPEAEVHPLHEPKLLLPAVAGALKLYVDALGALTVNEVVPLDTVLVTAFPYPIETPLAGFVLATVMV